MSALFNGPKYVSLKYVSLKDVVVPLSLPWHICNNFNPKASRLIQNLIFYAHFFIYHFKPSKRSLKRRKSRQKLTTKSSRVLEFREHQEHLKWKITSPPKNRKMSIKCFLKNNAAGLCSFVRLSIFLLIFWVFCPTYRDLKYLDTALPVPIFNT